MRQWIIFLLCLVSLASLFQPARAQIGSPPLPVADSLTARPRILLTRPYIEQTLHPRMEANTESWQIFFAYVSGQQPEADVAEHPVEVTRSLAVAYLVTGERGFADRAKIGLLRMVDYLENHPAMNNLEPWDAAFLDYLAGIAVAYDWLYDTFSAADRTALGDVMLRAAAVLNDPTRDIERIYYPKDDDGYRFISFDHWGSRTVWALTATGITLLGENPAAPDLIDYARDLFTGWIIPTLDQLSGGSWAEGPTYGYLAGWANVQTATAFWTARGENMFDNTRWWYDRMAYDMFLTQPSIQHVRNQPDGMPLWGYSSIIGDSERYSQAALFGRAQDMLLSTIYAGTDHAAWMNWFLGQSTAESDIPVLQGWMAVEEFLWRDAAIAGFPPPWKIWYTAGTGQVFLRSSWEADAVTIQFNAGDHFSAHQFFDQGSLTITRGGDELLVRSGVYSGEGASDHDANYYGRTIAANTLLICDLGEDFDGIRPNRERAVWLNDCGQRPVPPAVNPYVVAEKHLPYETGTILRFSEEGNLHYFRADLTPAYNSTVYVSPGNQPKVSEVLREFIYIRPGWLVIHDRAAPINDGSTLINMMHLSTPPTENGDWLEVRAGNSLMYLGQFAPQAVYQLSEGYSVQGETIEPIFNPYENQPYGIHHVQFVDSNFFLTVIAVDDERFSLAPPTAAYVPGDGVYGVRLNDWQLMFDDDPGDITQATYPVLPDVPNLFLTGLEPLGSYRVTLPAGTRTTMQADDAGTLYIFLTELGQEIRIQRR
jgi:hypothetical protein